VSVSVGRNAAKRGDWLLYPSGVDLPVSFLDRRMGPLRWTRERIRSSECSNSRIRLGDAQGQLKGAWRHEAAPRGESIAGGKLFSVET